MYADYHRSSREPELDRQFQCDCCKRTWDSASAQSFELPGGDWLIACPPCVPEAEDRAASLWEAAEAMDTLELAFMGNA